MTINEQKPLLLIGGRRTRETFELLAIQQVLGSDLDLLELVQDVELGQVERSVAVDQSRVLHDDQIEPTASSASSSRSTVLGSNLLEVDTDVLSRMIDQTLTA